jgi:hypothetical protein
MNGSREKSNEHTHTHTHTHARTRAHARQEDPRGFAGIYTSIKTRVCTDGAGELQWRRNSHINNNSLQTKAVRADAAQAGADAPCHEQCIWEEESVEAGSDAQELGKLESKHDIAPGIVGGLKL